MSILDFCTPLTQEDISSLRVGASITLSGTIYTARDAAHKRLCETLDNGQPLPFDFDGQVVFYAGPCPAPPGKPIGSVGPTTAGRMDAYSPMLIDNGLKVMIGKGNRSPKVVDAIIRNKGLYLVAVGGVAALLAKCVVSSEIVAYSDLETEAIRRLDVVGMPLIVAIDSLGNSLS